MPRDWHDTLLQLSLSLPDLWLLQQLVLTYTVRVQVMERLLLQHNYSQVIYLGDGAGDFCPCTRLGSQDIVLARQRYPSGAECALLRMAAREGWPMAQHSVDAGLGVSCREAAQPWQQATSHTEDAAQQRQPRADRGNNTPLPGAAKLDAVCYAWSTPSQAAALLRDLSGMRMRISNARGIKAGSPELAFEG